MSDDSSTATSMEHPPDTVFEQVRSLGTSPTGESFEVVRIRTEEESLEDTAEVAARRFVLKKITHGRLRSPEHFRQKFAALCRLEHPGLCPYRELYVGEKASRITRDFVAAMPLDEYLLRPITDEESAELRKTSIGDDSATEEDSDFADRELPDDSEPGTDADGSTDAAEMTEDDGADDDSDGEADQSPSVEENNQGVDSDDESTDDRPSTLEIPEALLHDSEAADRALDLIILRLRRIIGGLVDALEYLHRFRHVHGNLTPANILITDDEDVVLTDYGLYPELDIPSDSRSRFTSYRAPECEGGEYSPECDLYSLGAILFEVLAERRYGQRRRADTPNGVEGDSSPLYLSEIVPHCPASWVDLIHGLLAPNPEDRPPLDEIHRQLAEMEARSVNIPASSIGDEPEMLYGRSDSLDQLKEAAKTSSQRRHFGIAVVEGETGVGKSALLDTLARRNAQRGWVVLHGRCFHREPIAYQGWEEIADRLADITDNLPETPRNRLAPGRHRASRLFPQLASDGDDTPDVDRSSAVDGFRQLLKGISEQRPILICFDDIHWAGHDSLRLLADLAERPEDMRVMVVATWQAGNDLGVDHPFRTELATAPVDIGHVTIEGFSKSDAREYVLSRADHLSLRQKQRVLRRGGLNPLLIDELIFELDEESEEQVDDADDSDTEHNSDQPQNTEQRSEVDDPGDDDDGDIDHHLRSFVEQRLTDLSRSERLVLQLLAVASAPLSASLLARAITRELGTQTADVVTGREVAESLIEMRLARRARRIKGNAKSSDRYVVVHDLCRRVLLDELGQDHHARLCALIADALASGDDAADDLRFEYLLRAGRGEEAARAAVLAARAATHRFAYYRAARLWRWLDGSTELDERDRHHFAVSLFGSAQYEEAVEQYDELLPASISRADLDWRCDRVRAFLCAGQRQEAIDAMDSALQAASTAYKSPSALKWLGDTWRRLSVTTSRLSDAAASASDALPDGDALARADLYDFSLLTAPFLLSHTYRRLESQFAHLALDDQYGPLLARDRLLMVGRAELPFLIRDGSKRDRWLEQASMLAERFDDRDAQVRTLEMSALVARHRGDLAAAAESVTNARDLVDRGEVSAPVLSARLLRLQIDLSLASGELDGANTLIYQLLHRYRHRRWLSVLGELAACDRDLLVGNLDAAERRLEIIDQFIGEDRDTLIHLWMMDRQTRFEIACGHAEVAIARWDLLLDRVYGRSLRRQPGSRFLIYLNLARGLAAVAARQGNLGETQHRQSVRRLRRILRRLGDLESWMGCMQRAEYCRLQARYFLICERPQKAERWANNATDAVGDHLLPVQEAMNREVLGFVHRRLERPEGRTMLEEARETYEELGYYLPLVLEGWPVPRSHARLELDDE